MDDGIGRGFAALPAEILLDIAESLTDLGSLHQLLQISSAFRRLSDDSAILIRVIEEILRPMPEWVHFAARIHFRLYIGSLPVALKEKAKLVQALGAKTTQYHDGTDTLADIEAPPSKIRAWLALADRVESLAHRCLQNCLDNCRQARPARLRDQKFRYATFRNHWEARPEGHRYKIPPEGLRPPSWIEEERALRVAWLLRVSFEIGDQECKLITDALSPIRREQLLTVKETPMNLRPSTAAPLMPAQDILGTDAPELHFAPLNENEWREGGKSLKSQMNFVYGFFIHARTHPRSPLRGASFAPYRRLGFAMWERRRMVWMGFLDQSTARSVLQPDGLYFTWRSLLTAEEDEEIGRKRRERDVPINSTHNPEIVAGTII